MPDLLQRGFMSRWVRPGSVRHHSVSCQKWCFLTYSMSSLAKVDVAEPYASRPSHHLAVLHQIGRYWRSGLSRAYYLADLWVHGPIRLLPARKIVPQRWTATGIFQGRYAKRDAPCAEDDRRQLKLSLEDRRLQFPTFSSPNTKNPKASSVPWGS